MSLQRTNRRQFLSSAAAAGAAAALWPLPAIAQGAAPRVVVVGGGFAGASFARALKQANPRIAVTLVEASQTFTACPFSNLVIGGLREISAQQFGYDKVAADGITMAFSMANGVNPQARSVTLANGTISTMTAWWWRPGSTSAGMRSLAITKRPRKNCRMPGVRASRPRCCAASSKPWRTAAWC